MERPSPIITEEKEKRKEGRKILFADSSYLDLDNSGNIYYISRLGLPTEGRPLFRSFAGPPSPLRNAGMPAFSHFCLFRFYAGTNGSARFRTEPPDDNR
jgi:hypothetical protein